MSGPARHALLADVARAWSQAMSSTAEGLLPGELAEQYLHEQLDILIEALGY